MIVARNVFSFCRTQAYVQRFADLEKEVNRREKELIERREQLKKFRELTQLTGQDRIQKILKGLTGEPFESEAVRKEKEKLRAMYDLLEDVKKEGDSRNAISQRLAEEERLSRQKVFLNDLARFANKFRKVAFDGKYVEEVKVGLELSCKSLESKLEKQGVQFLGSVDEKYNKQLHQKVGGQGQVISVVQQRGIRTRSSLISKAKIRAKQS